MIRSSLYSLLIICFLTCFSFCKQEKSTDHFPMITFMNSDTTLSKDGDVVGEGMPLKFGIRMLGGGAKITNLVIRVCSENDSLTMLDLGLYKDELDTTLKFYKNHYDNETWKFIMMNNDRKLASCQLNIIRDSITHYGEIIYYSSIQLGFQNNSTLLQFFDPDEGRVYGISDATINQDVIDILVYYFVDGTIPSPTFSSPGDQDAPAYYSDINNWNTKNYTKYDYVSKVDVNEFDAATNDSLLIKSYNEFWGRRKYKYAIAGTIFPFKTASGKVGIIKVNAANQSATGSVTFEMKIQK